jgi:hypothetical protein
MKLYTFLFFLFIICFCSAQQYSYKRYTIFDGLPQNQIVRVFHRSDDKFYLSTKGEMCKFDGARIEHLVYQHLTRSVVHGFFEFNNQLFFHNQSSLFFCSNNKVYLFKEFKDFIVSKIKINTERKEAYILSDSCFQIHRIGKKNISFSSNELLYFYDINPIPNSNDYLVSSRTGVYRYSNKGGLTKLFSGLGSWQVVIGNKIFVLNIINNGQNTTLGYNIYAFDGVNFKLIYNSKNNTAKNIFIKTKNNNIIFVQNESIWIRIDTSGNVVDKDSLMDVMICDITEDDNGNLFIGTENGVFHQQSKAFRNFDWKSSMPRYVWSIFEDKDSVIVFASFMGQLFWMKNNVLSEVPNYRQYMLPNELFYMNGFCNSLGQWMIPTCFRILIYDHGNFSFLPLTYNNQNKTCLSAHEDTLSKNVYFGTNGDLFIYNLLSKDIKHLNIENCNVLNIEKDIKGNLWICTNKAVFLLENDSILIKHYDPKLANDGVVSAKSTGDGNMWYANKDGLYCYDGLSHIRISEGHYYFISLWDNKKIVAGGTEGLITVDLEKFKKHNLQAIQKFDRYNGFLGIECGQNGSCIDSKGKIWIPTSESVICFDPSKTYYDTVPPRPFLVSFEISTKDLLWKKINNSQIYSDTLIKLEPKQNNIRIICDGLEYINREQIKYRYRLTGYSDIWTETNNPEAIFTNLSPGSYCFELIAINENGYSSEPVQIIKFKIKHAFYQTWEFKTIVILFSLIIVAGVIYLLMRRKQILKNKELEVQKELVEMQVKTINAQLDPHFVFNTIAAIGSEVQEKNNDKAYDYFVKISQLLRNSIENTSKITRTIEDEIQFVTNYLKLQKFRFEDRFDYNIYVDPDLDLKIHVPKMSIQIFVENAMKHGIEHLSSGGLLQVSAINKSNGILFLVEDNGIGRAASAKNGSLSNGVGLKVFNKFFEIMNRYNDKPAGFVIHDLYNEKGEAAGTRVELFIPDGYKYEI